MEHYKGPANLRIFLYSRGVEDEVFLIGKFDLCLLVGEQKSHQDLERMAIDNLWDSRLDCTGNVPMVYVLDLESGNEYRAHLCYLLPSGYG